MRFGFESFVPVKCGVRFVAALVSAVVLKIPSNSVFLPSTKTKLVILNFGFRAKIL